MYDLIIKSGTIIDGTRYPRRKADLAIRDGVVAAIGSFPEGAARQVIDAEGLIVAPGHIDCHTHYDAQINWDPYCSNSGENGVTTVVAGNCGFAFAPCRPADRERYMLMMENTEQVPLQQMRTALPWTWTTFPEWLDHLRSLPKGVNIMMYVPMNPLLIYVMGIDDAKTRRPTSAELKEMKRLIVEGMRAGACGLAMSYLGDGNTHTDFDGSPMPADCMHREDAVELASALKEVDAGTIQLLSQFAGIDDKELAIEMHVASGRPVLLNIVESVTVLPGEFRPQLEWLTKQNELGYEVFGQTLAQRAWTEFNLAEFNLNDNVPEWREISTLPNMDAKLEKLRDPDFRARLRDNYNPRILTGSGPVEELTVVNVNDVPSLQKHVGRTIGEIAQDEGKDPVDVFFDVSVESGGWADFRTPILAGANLDDAVEIITHPYIVSGVSDGGAHSRFYIGGHWPTELLTTVGREKGIPLEELHYRFAWQPARVMGLQNRGALLPGYAADVVIYDFEKLDASADTYVVRHDQPGDDWRRYLETSGYRWVIVNGEITFVDGAPTESRPGRLLSNGGAPQEHALAAE